MWACIRGASGGAASSTTAWSPRERRLGGWIQAFNARDRGDLAAVEARLRDDARIGILINNAGAPQAGSFLQQSADSIERLVALNSTALTRLAAAVAPRFAQAGSGAIVNIGSVVGLAPEFGATVYGATKAYVQFLSQGLRQELSPQGVYVQAVLPAVAGGMLQPPRRPGLGLVLDGAGRGLALGSPLWTWQPTERGAR